MLVEGDNKLRYVVKYQNNPRTTRSLITQLIAGQLMRLLSLSTPMEGTIRLSRTTFQGDWPQIEQPDGSLRDVIEGWHFASLYGSDGTGRTAVYDFLPTPLLESVENGEEFARLAVADSWLGMSGDRQAIFERRHNKQFWVSFIDHCEAFRYEDFPKQRYWAWWVYFARFLRVDALYRTASLIDGLASSTVLQQIEIIPNEWFQSSSDIEETEAMLTNLAIRCKSVHSHVDHLCEMVG